MSKIAQVIKVSDRKKKKIKRQRKHIASIAQDTFQKQNWKQHLWIVQIQHSPEKINEILLPIAKDLENLHSHPYS